MSWVRHGGNGLRSAKMDLALLGLVWLGQYELDCIWKGLSGKCSMCLGAAGTYLDGLRCDGNGEGGGLVCIG